MEGFYEVEFQINDETYAVNEEIGVAKLYDMDAIKLDVWSKHSWLADELDIKFDNLEFTFCRVINPFDKWIWELLLGVCEEDCDEDNNYNCSMECKKRIKARFTDKPKTDKPFLPHYWE